MRHHALTDKARSLVSQMAKLDAELLETLNAIYSGQVFKAEGYDSMHEYCVGCLGMSSDQAYRKLQAARLMQRFPTEVRDMLESGDAKLTHLAMIEKVVTSTNALQLLEEVRGKSTREVERMLRREDPKPDVTEAVTRVSAPRQESVELLAPDHWALRAMMDDATKAIYDETLDLLTFEQRTPGEVLKLALIELKERLMVKKRRTLRSAAKPKDRDLPPANRRSPHRPPNDRPPQSRRPLNRQPLHRPPNNRSAINRPPPPRPSSTASTSALPAIPATFQRKSRASSSSATIINASLSAKADTGAARRATFTCITSSPGPAAVKPCQRT